MCHASRMFVDYAALCIRTPIKCQKPHAHAHSALPTTGYYSTTTHTMPS